MKNLIAALFFTFGFLAGAFAEPAPAFTARDINGVDRSLASQQGKIVVLEWFNPGCPFVKKHYESGNMQKLQDAYTKKGVVWLTIDSSAEGKQGHLTEDEARDQIKEWNIKSSGFVLDPSGSIGKLYSAKTTPALYVIDREGRLVYEGAIDDKPSASPSSLEGARNYLAEALDKTIAGEKVQVASTESYGCSIKYAS